MADEKLTLQEQLEKRVLKPVGTIPYLAVTLLSKVLYYKKYGVSIERRINLDDFKGKPYVVISNHASRLDYIFIGLALWPQSFNYVVGYNEFFRSHLSMVMRLEQVVPKKNFCPQPYAIKQVMRIIRAGGRVIILPEGMSSISGANQPCALGGGQLLKMLGVPVLYTKIAGGYMTSPKFCLDERPGKVQVVLDQMFTAEQLKSMSADEIQQEMDLKLWHDDYAWNKKARVKFNGGGQMAKNMHQLLFWCPKCGSKLEMETEGNVIRCRVCGNNASLNEYYDLLPGDDSCVIPETPTHWFDMQRAHVRELVSQPGFVMTERVKLGTLPKYEYLKDEATSEIVGEGELSLDREGLRYEGTRDGAPYSFFVPIRQIPSYGMCTDVSRFYTFVDGEFTELYPDRESTELWFLATEELHRLTGGPWMDFSEDMKKQQAILAEKNGYI